MRTKLLGICCSPRKGRATYRAMQACLASAEEVSDEIETQVIELADKVINPCRDCGVCREELTCGIEDEFRELIPTLADEDIKGMIIGTPVYLCCMTAQCKAFIDRSAMFRRNGWLFRNRVGGVFAVGGVRNGGQELTIQAVRSAMLCHDMICVSEGKPTAHLGGTVHSGHEGGVEADTFGLETVRNLGRRVAEVALMLAAN
ncbi:MAG: flavodoxin family protein [Phycisphaerae bacterium]|nr:flavodoxin family protein [Phycisphaerae bacterium]